jgi:hypothetical protein
MLAHLLLNTPVRRPIQHCPTRLRRTHNWYRSGIGRQTAVAVTRLASPHRSLHRL